MLVRSTLLHQNPLYVLWMKCTIKHVKNITHRINDGDFWGEAIGLLQKPTELKLYIKIKKFSLQVFPSDTNELWSAGALFT